jgi:hypothetical protein
MLTSAMANMSTPAMRVMPLKGIRREMSKRR